MEKGYCRKCGKYDWLHQHHILPFSKFGNGETVNLCPNCHTDYHKKLGRKNLKNDSIEFHYEMFFRWLTGLSIGIAILLMLL